MNGCVGGKQDMLLLVYVSTLLDSLYAFLGSPIHMKTPLQTLRGRLFRSRYTYHTTVFVPHLYRSNIRYGGFIIVYISTQLFSLYAFLGSTLDVETRLKTLRGRLVWSG